MDPCYPFLFAFSVLCGLAIAILIYTVLMALHRQRLCEIAQLDSLRCDIKMLRDQHKTCQLLEKYERLVKLLEDGKLPDEEDNNNA